MDHKDNIARSSKKNTKRKQLKQKNNALIFNVLFFLCFIDRKLIKVIYERKISKKELRKNR